MAKSLSRGAAHVILRRNLRYLVQECPHAALVEGISLEELLPSIDDGGVRPMFNGVVAAPLVDALDSPHADALLVTMGRLLRMCSSEFLTAAPSRVRRHVTPLLPSPLAVPAGVHHGHLNSFLTVPAYESLASMCPPATFLHAAQRAWKGVLLHMSTLAPAPAGGTSDDGNEWRHGRGMAVIASLLHAYCVCSQHSPSFCEAVGEQGHASRCDLQPARTPSTVAPPITRRRRHGGTVRFLSHPHPGGLPVRVH